MARPRLVSLHDPDARPIRKGRIDRPVEFGYKAQVTDNDDGIILDYAVEYGAAPDGPQLAPVVHRISRAPAVCRARSPPTAATASPPSNTTCTLAGCAPSRSPARPPPHPPARPSSTAAASAPWSSGTPAAAQGRRPGHRATRMTRSPVPLADAKPRRAGSQRLVRTVVIGSLATGPFRVGGLGGVEEPDGRTVQVGASHRMSAFDVTQRDVACMAQEPSDALSARSVLPLAARVIMVHVDELPLLKRLVAHAAGVLLPGCG
jgi:hypothetical protein